MKTLVKYLIYISIIVILSFVLPRLIPGSPLFAMSEDINAVGIMTNEAFKAFQEYYAPELPVLEQFWKYFKSIINLDFGYSFYYKMPVNKLIKERIGWTFLLSFLSILISSIIGIFFGIRSGLKDRESKFMISVLLSVQAIPTFLIAAIFQIVIAYKLRLLPPTGAYSPGMYIGQHGYIKDVLKHILLPLLVLTISGVPSIYIFKNIIPELLGRLNIQFVLAITGSIFVEVVFSYPGLGQLLRNAISYRDYPLLQGILLVSCIYGLIVNLIFELVVLKNIKRY